MRSFFLGMGILLFLFTGCATDETHLYGNESGNIKFTKHFDNSIFKIAGKGLFSVEIVTDRKDLGIDKDMIGLIIHNRHDEDVTGADIQVVALVPGQGQNKIIINEIGGGLYSSGRVNLNMDSKLELRVRVKKGDAEDVAVFEFPDVKKIKMPHGEYESEK